MWRNTKSFKHIKKWIVDTDCGIDDAHALFLALKHLDLAGITTCHGNTNLDNVNKNVGVVQHVAKTSVPVYSGSRKPIVDPGWSAAHVHHDDGLGGLQAEYSHLDLLEHVKKDRSAVQFTLDTINENPGEIGVITLGPLTNLAIATLFDEGIASRIGALVVLGGNYQGVGNISHTAEFNMRCDPEAAQVVFQRYKGFWLIPWETIKEFSLEVSDPKEAFKDDDDCSAFLRKLFKFQIEALGHISPCDSLTVPVVSEEETVVTEVIETQIEMVLTEPCRGMVMIHHYTEELKPNVKIIAKMNYEKVVSFITENLAP